jgi:hypothetical protein
MFLIHRFLRERSRRLLARNARQLSRALKCCGVVAPQKLIAFMILARCWPSSMTVSTRPLATLIPADSKTALFPVFVIEILIVGQI